MTSTADRAQELQDPEGTTSGLPASDEFSIFTGEPVHSLRDMLTEVTFTSGPGEEFAATSMFNGLRSLVPFCHAGSEGFSIVRVYLAPNYILPAHTHNSDCLYYVLRGRAILGKRVIEPGGGFFVPSGKAYGYTAGDEGVEVLEFRHATTTDFHETERSPARWQKILDNAEKNDGWKDADLPY
jgi:quercetin dioxygenase-like cupin family protein